MKPLFILGAGVSAPSGIPTYRQDENSLYNDEELMDIMHVASLYDPEHLKKLQRHFADWKALIDSKQPNPAHTLITEMVETYGGFVVTQNVDNYLELTGLDKKRIYHIHGDFSRKKPRHNVVDIVLFGEGLADEPAYLKNHFKDFDTIIIAGTSLTVTSVYKYIKPDSDIYVINKESIELPLPQEMYKSVTFIQKDIIEGLQDLKILLNNMTNQENYLPFKKYSVEITRILYALIQWGFWTIRRHHKNSDLCYLLADNLEKVQCYLNNPYNDGFVECYLNHKDWVIERATELGFERYLRNLEDYWEQLEQLVQKHKNEISKENP